MKKTPLKTIVEWIQIREKEKTKQRNYQDKKKASSFISLLQTLNTGL